MTAETLQIVIDVRVDGDQISGHAGDAVGQPKRFSGWLGLIGALDGLIGNPRFTADGPTVRACVAFATAAQAEAFAGSEQLREAMRQAGADGAPEIWFTHSEPERAQQRSPTVLGGEPDARGRR